MRIRDTDGDGIGLKSQASASLTNVEVSDIRPLVNGDDGKGILVDEGSTLTATGLVVSDTDATGLYVLGGASADISDCVVRGTRSDAYAANGMGIWARDGATVRMERCRFSDTELAAVFVQEVGTEVELVDVAIEDPRVSVRFGFGGGGSHAGRCVSGKYRNVRCARAADVVVGV